MKTETGYGKLLINGEFEALLWTQVLGGFNISFFAVNAVAGNPALAGAIFAIPFLLFAGYSGQIADRFSKTRVLRATKAFEIAIMPIAIAALLAASMKLQFAVLFLLAAQTAFFGPAKYGIVPEMVDEGQVTRANALLAFTAFIAIAAGASFGAFVHPHGKSQPLEIGLTPLVVAIAGWAASFGIPRVPASAPKDRASWNPTRGIVEGMRRLRREKSLAWSVFGISWFWFAVLFYVPAMRTGSSLVSLAAGFGLGSVAAGALSGDYIELGFVPAALALMGVSSIGLDLASGHALTNLWLALAGCGAGVFLCPLNALLQHDTGTSEKGRLQAANNFANVIGVIAALAVLRIPHVSLRGIAFTLGAVMIVSSFYLMVRMRAAVVRFILWGVVNLLFRIRIEGTENIPRTGGALLASNHISYADAVLVGCLTRRRTIHFLIWQPIFDVPVANYFFRMLQSIPIDAASPKATVRALRAAREELKKGELAGIFPEGAISRTGEIRPFERGFEKLMDGSDLPIIPIRIEGLYGHPLSCKGGAPFRSWQKLWRPVVSVRAGAPIHRSVTPVELREAVLHA